MNPASPVTAACELSCFVGLPISISNPAHQMTMMGVMVTPLRGTVTCGPEPLNYPEEYMQLFTVTDIPAPLYSQRLVQEWYERD